mmetsp:Transcript_95173/g.116523  ORF Transcript_95173/g.116523 Transcript_95173/m.116523 type:complete len:587 (+) Transcript_95173:62-1822(+)
MSDKKRTNLDRLYGYGLSAFGMGLLAIIARQYMVISRQQIKLNNINELSSNNKIIKSALKPVCKELPLNYMGKTINLKPYYLDLLSQLPEPKLLFKHFMLCLQTPRPSGKLNKIHNALKDVAKILDVEYNEDTIGNVVLRKKATKGYENSKGIIIQCHMDMVTTKTEDSKFDFENDGIQGYISENGKLLKAKKTTLGADDGIGVASGLALLEDPYVKHGPLEVLITVDEETTMGGAINIDKKPFLKGSVYINVDSEESNSICVGCAGGFGKHVKVNMEMNEHKSNELESKLCYEINLKDLNGGHTGIQIHEGRANAIICLARILNYLINDKNIDISIAEMNGGNAQNAIPSYSSVKFIIDKKHQNLLETSVKQYWDINIINEFKEIEPSMKMFCKPCNINNKMNIGSIESSKTLIELILNLPNGVIRMNPSVSGLVQTSISLSIIKLSNTDTQACIELFGRSPSMDEMKDLNRKIDCLIRLSGNNVECSGMLNEFPGWDPNMNSYALDICKQAHESLFNKKPHVYAVHAGLECGLIMDKYPNIDCISIGPTILGAHSTDERLEIDTVLPFYNWLRETVQLISDKTK